MSGGDELHAAAGSINQTYDEVDDGFVNKMWKKVKPEHDCKYYLNPKNSIVLILIVAVISFGTANRVMFKKMLIPMQPYSFFLNQLTSFIYIPVFWPIVWGLMYFTDRIDAEQRQFPWYKFLIMGLLDATAGVFMTFGGANTSGPMQLLLSQGAIPFTMFFSILVSLDALAFIFRRVLQVKYKWNHYAGASIIIIGIFVALYGQFFGKSDSSESAAALSSLYCGDTPFASIESRFSSAAGDTSGTKWYGALIFFSANVPLAFSGVYKEIAFKGASLDVFYVNAWVATYQFFLGLLSLPLEMVPGFGGIKPSDIPSNLWDGAKCSVGITSGQSICCDGAYWQVGGYLFANIFYNIVLLAMIKYGSAALFYICSAVILPLADICFTFEFIMGKGHTSKLSIYDICGLVILLTGLILYRLVGESGGGEEAEEDVEDQYLLDKEKRME